MEAGRQAGRQVREAGAWLGIMVALGKESYRES